MPRRLVLLGPPAAGKGTQAELLKERFGFQNPSVGAMLRAQKAAGTPAGLRAAEYFDKGLLVPDEISTEVVRQWLIGVAGNWVLDGYPRSPGQADAFEILLGEQAINIDHAVLIDIPESVVRDRIAHRLMCPSCGGIFREDLHVAAASDPCPRCGAKLTRRADDNPQAVDGRMGEYRAKTEPVIKYYRQRGLLREINGDRPIEAVFADFSALLDTDLPA